MKLPVRWLLPFVLWSCPEVRAGLRLHQFMCLCAGRSVIGLLLYSFADGILLGSCGLGLVSAFDFPMSCLCNLFSQKKKEEILSCTWPVLAAYLLCV